MKKSTFIITVVIVFLVLVIIVLLTYIFTQKLKIDNLKMQEINRNIQMLDEFTGEETKPKDSETKIEKTKEQISKVEFNDNQILAIGCVTEKNEPLFVQRYFYNEEQYNNIKVLNMTTKLPDYVESDLKYGNKFVIIPKNTDVKITVRTCMLDSNYELELDQIALKDHTGPLIIYTNEIEVVPELFVFFEYNGYTGQMPLMFKGIDGTIDLTGNEMEVKDISIYSIY